jgi:hypothetical protein
LKSFDLDCAWARSVRVVVAVALMACSCALELETSTYVQPHAAKQLRRNCQSSLLVERGERTRSVSCIGATSVLNRKEERRESNSDSNHFRGGLCQRDAPTEVVDSFALSIITSERLSGTPPPVWLT